MAHPINSIAGRESTLLAPTTNANIAMKMKFIENMCQKAIKDFPKKLGKIIDNTPGVKSEGNRDLEACTKDVKKMANKFKRKCIDFYVNDQRNQAFKGEVKTINGQKASPIMGLYALAAVGESMLDLRFDISNATATSPKSWITTMSDMTGHDLNNSSSRQTALLAIVQDVNRNSTHNGFDSTILST